MILVRGEGELTIVELTDHLKQFGVSSKLNSVRGISYIYDGAVFHNPERELIADLNALPFPARYLLPIEKYNWKIGGKPAINILSSRGCPFNCIYCFKSIFKNKIRYRSAENIIAEIKDSIEKLNREGVFFVDDHFTYDNIRLESIFNLLKRNKLQIKWRCLTRVDGFQDVLLLQKMKENGCDTIIFGAESGDSETLVKIRKGITLEQSRNTILAAKKAGINLKVNFMLGFPWETYKSTYNTIKFAADLPLVKEYAFYFVTPFPGTEIWETYCKNSKFTWEDFTEFNAFFRGKTLAEKDYRNLLIYAELHIFRKYFVKELFKFKAIKLFLVSVKKNGLKKALFKLSEGGAPFIDDNNPFRAVPGLLYELRDRPDKPILRSIIYLLDPHYLQRRIKRESKNLKNVNNIS